MARDAVRPKVYLDLFHLGNRRTPVRLDDVHYLALDADRIPSVPNPTYGRPEVFQPPMSARLGVTVDFGTIIDPCYHPSPTNPTNSVPPPARRQETPVTRFRIEPRLV